MDVKRIRKWTDVYFHCRLSGGINRQRYLVRVKTAAEAHAIVRRLHMTYCRPWTDGKGNASLVQARVLY